MTDETKERKEWSVKNIFNPFNSMKVLAHYERFKKIKRGNPLPPPVTISLDLTSQCNNKCYYCNSEYALEHNKNKMDKETILEMCDFLKYWNVGGYKVLGSCIGGNGESTINKNLDTLIENLYGNIGMGLITNGTLLNRHSKLGKLNWLGVSVDAGTKETYKDKTKRDYFDKVISNIKKTHTNNPHLDISYKYLLLPENVNEVYISSTIAKKIGCRNIHIRPFGNPWDRNLNNPFTKEHIETFQKQLELARTLEDENFSVYGITHKFNPDFTPVKDFKKCYGILITGAISPKRSDKYKFCYQMCCDRRGDESLIKDFRNFEDFERWWGSDEHFDIVESININKCPRCTQSQSIKIYENVILNDKMDVNFI